MKDIDFSLPIKNGPTDRGFDYYFGIPASLDISPYVYVENNKATSIPDHVNRTPEKESGITDARRNGRSRFQAGRMFSQHHSS